MTSTSRIVQKGGSDMIGTTTERQRCIMGQKTVLMFGYLAKIEVAQIKKN